MITVIIFLIVIYFAWRKPPVVFAMLLQINIIRSLSEIDFYNPCFNCVTDSDPILGAILPILSFLIVLFKLDFDNKSLKIKLDRFDLLFIVLISSLVISSITSYSISDSAEYTARFLFLAFPYYFIVKIYFLNSKRKPQDEFITFLKTTFYLSIFFALFSIYLTSFKEESIWRLTIPGVHPIPFSQSIGFGVLIGIIMLLTKKSNIFYYKKYKFKLVLITSFFLLIVLFASNTRGVLIALIIALVYLLKMNPIKIKKNHLYSGIIGFLLILTTILSQLDLTYYFRRFTELATDESILQRIKVYFESFPIFYETSFLGTGPGAFKYYSFLEYPHNLFLESMAVMGIMGVAFSIYFIFLILWILINTKAWKNNIFLIFSITIFLFYFTESMFSFTLWMHKGLFLSLALISIAYHEKGK